MKKFLLALLLIFTSTPALVASHLAAGEVWYEHVPDPNTPYKYRVFLKTLRDDSGVSLCNSSPCYKTICIKSSCFSDLSLTLTSIPQHDSVAPLDTLASGISYRLAEYNKCLDSSALSANDYEYYLFSGEIILPGPCHDFNFHFNGGTRSPNDNLRSPTSANFHVYASLNNTYGPNSTVVPQSLLAKAICINKNASWETEIINPDNDSLHYKVAQVIDGFNCNNLYNATYINGYSPGIPLGPSSSFSLNPLTGEISAFSSNIQNVVIKLAIEEYRLDVASNTWYIAGTVQEERMLIAGNYCNSSLNNWNISIDTLGLDSASTIKCNVNTINLKLNTPFLMSSLAIDGSDFGLVNYTTNRHPILSAFPTDTLDDKFAAGIKFTLLDSLYYDDTLILFSRLGNDLNTLLDECNFHLYENDSIYVAVNTCGTRISVSENTLTKFSIYPNPARNSIRVNLPSGPALPYSIYNTKGKVIIRNTISRDQPEVDIRKLPPGLYVFSLNGNQQARFIKH